MTLRLLTTAVLAGLVLSNPAHAANEMILLDPDDLSNLATFEVTGSFNRLVIEQVAPQDGEMNSIRLAIRGDRNGGPEGAVFSGVALGNGLTPGQLTQRGLGNNVEFDVRGDDNLFAVAQLGNNNSVRGTIVGFGNQSSISQTGNGNFVSFSQDGTGNTISVRQVGW